MKKIVISFIVVALLVTACSSKPKHTPNMPPPTDTPVPPTPTPIPRLPDGTYSTKVTQQELTSAGMDEYTACENAGTFELTLSGARWDIIQDAAPGCTVLNPKFGGSVMFFSDRVTFHDDEPFGCNADFTYKWGFDGARVRFTSVDDADCEQRAYYMSTHPWVKK